MGDCIWIHYARPRPHWYGLDESVKREKLAAWKAVHDSSARNGGVCHGRFHVRGQHDFETVETWRFADAEAAFRHWAALSAAGYGVCHAFGNHLRRAGVAPRP